MISVTVITNVEISHSDLYISRDHDNVFHLEKEDEYSVTFSHYKCSLLVDNTWMSFLLPVNFSHY